MENEHAARGPDGKRLPLLVFVHIPKTAGSTLNSILSHRYSKDEIYEIMMRGMSLRLPRRLLLPRRLVSTSKIRRLKAALKCPRSIAVVNGHLDLSIGPLLPANAEYITLLRHPVQRAISHYQHYRRLAGDPVHELAMRSSLAEWVSECGLVEMDNGQTRRLAGATGLPFGGVTSHTLDEAKHNLDAKFSIVGVTERFEEFQILVHRRLGWPYWRYPAQNVGRAVAAWACPEPGALRAITDCNRFDLELYRYAEERLDRAIRQFDLDTELSLLRSAPVYARERAAA